MLQAPHPGLTPPKPILFDPTLTCLIPRLALNRATLTSPPPGTHWGASVLWRNLSASPPTHTHLLPPLRMSTPICPGHILNRNCSAFPPHTVPSRDAPTVTVRRASALPLRFSWPRAGRDRHCPLGQNLRVSVPTLLPVRHVPLPHYKGLSCLCPLSPFLPPTE